MRSVPGAVATGFLVHPQITQISIINPEAEVRTRSGSDGVLGSLLWVSLSLWERVGVRGEA
jgi:hypothetical protein